MRIASTMNRPTGLAGALIWPLTKLGSCHTPHVGGYATEGHVSVREQPKAIGLAVPGMVMDSPRIDSLLNKGRSEPYTVLLVHLNGDSSVFQKYV